MWSQALDVRQNLPKPEHDNGWSISDGVQQLVLMTREPARSGLIELITCSCKKSSCRRTDCSCRTHNLACTEAYACMANEYCQNPKTVLEGDSESDDDDQEHIII